MGTEENKTIVRRLYGEVINAGNLDLAGNFIAEDVIENEEVSPHGLENFKEFFAQFRAAFPDLNVTIEDMIAEGDKVVVRMTIRGTHTGTGDFMGFVPRGKKIEIETIDIIRFADGKMVEHWGKTDTLGMLQQLGEDPTPEAIGNIRAAP